MTQNTQKTPKEIIKKSWRLCVNAQNLYSTYISTALNIVGNDMVINVFSH